MDLQILYQDDSVYVCVKPVGIVSEEAADHTGLADLLKEKNGGYIGVVHRLDRGVGGVMVYARTKAAAARLSDAVRTHAMKKTYLAIVHGVPQKSADTLTDLLYHDRVKNKTFVVDRVRHGVKEAILDYETVKSFDLPPYGSVSLLKIQLHTGRTHQIRVQFASRALPLIGDNKYGARDRTDIALFCHALSFPHPKTNQPLSFSALPEWG